MNKTTLSTIILSGALITATTAMAGPIVGMDDDVTYATSGFYTGLQFGYAKMDYKKSFLTKDPDITSVGSLDSDGLAMRLYAGYRFMPYLSGEIGVVALPQVEFKDIIVNGDTSNPMKESFDQSMLDVLAKAELPFTTGFNLFAKGGIAAVYRGDIKVKDSNGHEAASNDSDRTTVGVLGGGASVNFTRNLIGEVNYLHYFKSGDLPATDFGGVGAVYLFG